MKPELLAPAGTPQAAYAAFAAGADAVYLGMREFSARAEAGNFDRAELSAVIAHAHSLSPRRSVHVALNTLLREDERPALARALETLEELGPDAVIVQDPGVARMARRHFPSLALHASTQMAVHSVEGVRAAADMGFVRVVMARECTLEEIAAAAAAGVAQVETFLHGALCYSVSGLCLYSAMERGRSGNRGRCSYGCREGRDGAFPFSMRDLALAPVVEKLVATGVSSLKIEGRMKGPLWVSCATQWYRGLLDGTLDAESAALLRDDVKSVFAREWTTLYAEGEDGPPEGVVDPRSLGHRGAACGRVEGVSRPDRDGVRFLRTTLRRPLERHDGLQLKIPSFLAANDGHPWGFAVGRMRLAKTGREVFEAGPGDVVDIALPRNGAPRDIPAGLDVLLAASQDVARRHPLPAPPRTAALEGRPARFEIEISGAGIKTTARDAARKEVSAETETPGPFERARVAGRTEGAAREAFAKLGGTAWRVEDPARDVSVCGDTGLFVPAATLNAARRAAVEALDDAAAADRERRLDAALRDCGDSNPAPPAPALTLKAGLEVDPAAVPGALDRVGRAAVPGALDRAGRVAVPGALDRAGRVVLVLRNGLAASPEALAARLDAWEAALGGLEKLAVALPALCRDREAPALERAIDALLGRGVVSWEAADWAGVRRLRRREVRDWTADFTLPVENHSAAAALFELGAARCVLSPETPPETVAALVAARPGRFEVLRRQRVPLFVSATAPCGGGTGPVRRFGGNPPVVSFLLDGRWITVSEKTWTSSPPPGAPVREDLSWDPPPVFQT